jgi:hypothetical protein
MKKILVLLVLLIMVLTASTLFATDPESVLGVSNYVIDLGLKNYVQSHYGNNIWLETDLPVADKVKMILKASIEDDMDSTGGSSGWSKINNMLEFYIGIPVTDNVGIAFMLGGATAIDSLSSDANGWTKEGEGQLYIQLCLQLKSAMFANKLDNVTIRQMITMHLAGNGDFTKSGNPGDDTCQFGSNEQQVVVVDANKVNHYVFVQKPSSNTFNAQYFGINYQGRIMTGIPFEVGLPKFDIGLELGYTISSLNYSAVQNIASSGTTTTEIYDVLPTNFAGGFDFKLIFTVNPVANQEWSAYADTMYQGTKTSATFKGATNATTFVNNSFIEEIGSSWKITFAKIVYLKLDADWRFTALSGAGYYTNAAGAVIASAGKVTTLLNNVNPGILLGFNFDGWTLEMKWEPQLNSTLATSIYGNIANGDAQGSVPNVTADDTNIWNLSNWTISGKCTFPPPTK